MTKELKVQRSKIKTIVKILKLYILSFSFALCTLHFALFAIQPVYALDSSPSAEIKIKLEELKKEIASKAAKIKQQVSFKLKDKAYIGIIKSKSDTSLTLATNSGPKIISINIDTVFESKIKTQKKYQQKNIALEDYVAALGDTDETGVLLARKLVLLPPPKSTSPKTFLWGQIISISEQLLTLKDSESKNIAAIFPDSAKAKIGDFVILTGNKEKNDIFKAAFVYNIPRPGIPTPKPASPSALTNTSSSTPSAKPTTKSATPKPTSKPSFKPTPR